MPELPEVETVRRDLEKNRRPDDPLDRLQFFREDLRFPLPLQIAKHWQPQVLGEVGRRGKSLLFHFGDKVFLSHLGMSGNWRVENETSASKSLVKVDPSAPSPTEPLLLKHDHICLQFRSGRRWIYSDPRRFGFFLHFSKPEFASYLSRKNWGPEPLKKNLTFEQLLENNGAVTKTRPIKEVLMDPRFVVGVGNIYASEILYWAGVHPLQPTSAITSDQGSRIIYWMQEVLKDAIALGGSTLRDFSHVNGGGGSFQWSHMVYGRGDQPCVQCEEPISCTVLGGRSTFWCENCQPLL